MKELIAKIFYLTLATADKAGRPWCTPVYTAYSDTYQFYWASGFETRHSINIRENSAVGAVLYDSSIPEGEGQGLYIEGTAEELTPDTWQDGLQLLRSRSLFPDKFYPLEAYRKPGPVKIYRLIPKAFYMLNPDGDPRYDVYADCRREIILGD